MICATPEEAHKRKRAMQLAWYHRTKQQRGIKNAVRKTPEERRLKAREGERRRYRQQQALLGKTVRDSKVIHHTPEAKAEACREASRRYRQRNPEKRRASARNWNRRNMDRLVKQHRELYHADILFNLKTKLRRRISTALRSCAKGTRRHGTRIKLLGCSYREFKDHIASQFTKGMSWNGVLRGKIHLDHIIPCKAFRLEDPAEQAKCFHFTNIQPLWAVDNLSKGAKCPPVHQAELL